MARPFINIVLALIFVAIAGSASAQRQQPEGPAPLSVSSSSAPIAAPDSAPAGEPTASESGKMPDVAMPGPLGSEEKDDSTSPSGATALRLSPLVAGVAVAGFFYSAI